MSFLAANNFKYVTAVTTDGLGNFVIAGTTDATNLQTSPTVFRPNPPEQGTSSFVMKVSPDGTRILWATYFPGFVRGVAVDSNNNVVVSGVASTGFPVTPNAYQRTAKGRNDMFVAKLSSDGSTLLFATLLGGSGAEDIQGHPIAVSADGSILTCGTTDSTDFPVTAPGTQPSATTAFFARLSADGSQLLQSITYNADGCSVVLDAGGGAAVIAGVSTPTNSISKSFSATQVQGPAGNSDVYVAKFPPAPSATPSFVTVIGGTMQEGLGDLFRDSNGNLFIVGGTFSQDFPVTSGTFRPVFSQTHGAKEDTFVTKLSPIDGKIIASTFLDLFANIGVPSFPVGTSLSNTGTVLPTGNIVVIGPHDVDPYGNTIYPAAIVHLSGDLTHRIGLAYSDVVEAVSVGAFRGTTWVNGGIRSAGAGPHPNFDDVDGVHYYFLGQGDYADAGIAVADLSQPGPELLSVTNAASGAPATYANGLLLSLYGTGIGPVQPSSGVADASGRLPTALSQTVVMVGPGFHSGEGSADLPNIVKTAIPLLFVGTSQVNVTTGPPSSTIGTAQGNMAVMIRRQGVLSRPVQMSVSNGAPGIFSLDGSGTGQAAAINQDGTINGPTNPAAKGSFISLFATGLGAVTSGVAGDIASNAVPVAQNPIVTIANISAQVQYAGLAPTLVSSGYQVNVVIPGNAPTGPSVSLQLSVGGDSSQAGITIAIK